MFILKYGTKVNNEGQNTLQICNFKQQNAIIYDIPL
jgi:hypothetical protein